MPVVRVVVDLHSIHAQVRAQAIRMRGENQGQGDERPAVLGPARQGRKLRQIRSLANFGDRTAPRSPQSDPQPRHHEIARVPGLAQGGRKCLLNDVDRASNESRGIAAEGHLRSLPGAEEVRDQRKAGTDHVVEQQSRPARRDHSSMDLRRLQPGVDGCVDLDEVALAAKGRDEFTKICGHSLES